MTVTSGSWQTLITGGQDIENGLYAFRIELHDVQIWYWENLSFILYWFNDATNSNLTSPITFNQSGHAPNNGIAELRFMRHYAGRGSLEIYLNDGNTSGVSVKIYMYKLD